jgi:5-methylcytosine-specific restriction endonuclease McrA
VCGARATDVDHIVALALGGDRWARGNLQALCSEHHKTKTQQDAQRVREQRSRGGGMGSSDHGARPAETPPG